MNDVGVTDLHVHIQPWRQLKPAVIAAMRRGKEAHWDRLLQLMEDPSALLAVMDESGIWRVGLINYPSPDVMGFTDETNAFAARYARAAPERLIPFGGVHPRFTRDPEGQVEELLQLGIRCLKIPRRIRCTPRTPTPRDSRRWDASIVGARNAACPSRSTRGRVSSPAPAASSDGPWSSTTWRSTSPT